MKIALAIVMAATLSVPAFAEGNKNTNNSYSQSYSQSRSSSRATGGAGGSSQANNNGNSQTTNFRDRLQAPGLAVSGSYCSNAFGVSGPGFGLGFSFMERACKTEINARTANTYLGRPAAVQFVCQQSDFRNLTVCRPRR